MAEEIVAGPVDFAFLEFPEQVPTGEAAAELVALVDAGIIRLYDIVAIRRDEGGQVSTFDLGELSGHAETFARFAGARSGLVSDDDVARAGEIMADGTLGVVLVYENAWAGPFVAAARRAGGDLIASARIPAPDLIEALEAAESAG